MFFNVGSIFVALLIGIYLTVANSYDLMVKLTQSGELFDMSKLNDAVGSFTDSIYTLIAVFMLFRITVTMIEYLVDPDKLTDKSTGTGKLITRIIVSIILVIAFPLIMDNVVYPLQDALLSSDSIIFKFFNTGSSGSGTTGGTLSGGTGSGVNTGTNGSTNYGSEAECKKNCNGTCDGSVCKTEITSTQACVSEISKENSAHFKAKTAVVYGCKYNQQIVNAIKLGDENPKVTCQGPCSSNSYINDYDYTGGTNTTPLTIILKTTSSYNEALNSGNNVNFDEDYHNNISSDYIAGDTDGIKFAQSIIASFASNPDAIYENDFLRSETGNKKIATMVEEEEMTLDLFISIICGIIVVVVILVLCIEVVIRNLKMIVLELLAPIAFISYMNPNDKVLNNWFQKFIGCYLDLFIKILAIRMAVYFISLLSDTISGLTTILVYIAIFLFAKTVPNLISDIFGIKNMGGTFKDSMGALKTAAFAGVGAAAGAGAGILGSGMAMYSVRKAGGNWGRAFGAGALGLGSAATGAVKGLASGAKGKVGAGASSAWKANSARNAAYAQGATAGGIIGASLLSPFGADAASQDEKKVKQYDEILKTREALDKQMESEILKKNYNGVGVAKKNLDSILANGTDLNGRRYTAEEAQNYQRYYFEKMDAAKTAYLTGKAVDSSGNRHGLTDDVVARSYAQQYDRLVKEYKLDGVNQTIDDIIQSSNDPNTVPMDIVKKYKATKKNAEEGKITLETSEEFRKHKANQAGAGKTGK